MDKIIKTGCCGWSYLNEKSFSNFIKKKYTSKLQAYVQLYDAVEINSTYYRLPQISTAQKWRKEADVINPNFEFTVKAYQGITHRFRFRGDSYSFYNSLLEVVISLNAAIILFQSPASFNPTKVNIAAMQSFFKNVKRDNSIFVWEPRGKWYDEPDTIKELCNECNIIHCVDPLRNEPLCFGKENIAYFRLHGFGKPTMYNYDFSDSELKQIISIIESLPAPVEKVYVFFNNSACYENGLKFINFKRDNV